MQLNRAAMILLFGWTAIGVFGMFMAVNAVYMTVDDAMTVLGFIAFWVLMIYLFPNDPLSSCTCQHEREYTDAERLEGWHLPGVRRQYSKR